MSIEVYVETEKKPPAMQRVIIAGGLGAWDGERWLSMMPDSFKRPITWEVTWWAEIPATDHPLAAEVNRRRGEMAGLRETMRENGVQAKTILGGVNELLIYKRAMDSMASQMIHPKMTGMEMAKLQLGEK